MKRSTDIIQSLIQTIKGSFPKNRNTHNFLSKIQHLTGLKVPATKMSSGLLLTHGETPLRGQRAEWVSFINCAITF